MLPASSYPTTPWDRYIVGLPCVLQWHLTYLPRHSNSFLEYVFTEWKDVEKLKEQLLHAAEFDDKHSMSTHSISCTHALAWGLRPAHSQSKCTTSAGKACRNSLLVMPHSWVSGFLKATGTHLALAKKGNKKSRLTRSRKGMLFFFFFFEQINIYFNLVKQLVEALL